MACELKIGRGEDAVPPQLYHLSDGRTVQLIGTVDRADEWVEEDGTRWVRVVDYKTGTKKLDLKEVYCGLDCQMLLYLFSLTRDASGRFTGAEPAGVLYLLADPAPESTTRANAARSVEYKLDGLVRDEEKIFRAMDAEETGRYLPFGYLRGAPSPYQKDKRADAAKLSRIRLHLDDLVTQMGEQLYGGQIAAEPLVTGRSPCRWCDYGFICCHESGIGERALDAPAKPFEAPRRDREKGGTAVSGPKWTSAQQAAIDDRGGALLVSAAAGSGKTAVLTERAVRLITDPEAPIDADKLLIVTFTNAAAAELRARIGQALLRRSQAEPGNTALRRQRMLLQRAPICTIDAFCLDLLRKHFQALDIPPDFSPADPGSVETLRAAALAETLERAYADPDFCAFADLYGKGRSDKAAGETILHVYDFLRALPDYDRKLDEFLAPWKAERGFDKTCWHDLLLAEAARDAKAGRELFCAALSDCKNDLVLARIEAENKGKTDAARAKGVAGANDKFAEPLERLENAAALLGEVERLAKAGEWTPLYDRLTPYVLGMEPLPGLKGMKKRLTGEHKAAVKTRADEAAGLFGQILELISCSEDEAEADRLAALPRLQALFAAVRDFDARFAAKKQERKLLEFSDFEHQALRLLRSPDGTPHPPV